MSDETNKAKRPVARTDQVGSLLRPPELLAARERHTRGEITARELQAIEDTEILNVIAMQKEVGLDVITDGEYRRGWFGEGIYRAIRGLEEGEVRPDGRKWVVTEGKVSATAEAAQQNIVRPRGYTARATLSADSRFTDVEANFLKAHVPDDKLFKITAMAPAAYTQSWFVPGAAKEFPRGIDLLADVARIIKGEFEALAKDGVPYVQLDSLSYILRFGNPEETQKFLAVLGVSRDDAIAAIIAADNSILDAARAKGAITAVHMCRGNSRSAWNDKAGTYDVAERALAELRVDRLLLEYDTERAGGFEPLAFVPDETIVVLGLITSKFGELEKRDDILRRIDEASKYHPVSSFAISPQCGFASTAPGNLLTHDDQRRKLELVVAIADEVWGGK